MQGLLVSVAATQTAAPVDLRVARTAIAPSRNDALHRAQTTANGRWRARTPMAERGALPRGRNERSVRLNEAGGRRELQFWSGILRRDFHGTPEAGSSGLACPPTSRAVGASSAASRSERIVRVAENSPRHGRTEA